MKTHRPVVVYDTNILVRALAGKRSFGDFRSLVTRADIRLVTSLYILQEVETVLYTRFGLTRRQAKSAARALSRLADVLEVESAALPAISRDAKDDPVLALAAAAQADAICTYDRDLLVLGQYGATIIRTPEQLAGRL